jgi:hypothetical protein
MPRHFEIQQIDIELILKAFHIKTGQRLYIQAFSKSETGMRMREVLKAKLMLSRMYPDECAALRVRTTKILGKFYVFIEQTGVGPMMAYESRPDGKFKPIEVSPEADRDRRIRLMIDDGYTKEEILAIEGEAAEKYFS